MSSTVGAASGNAAALGFVVSCNGVHRMRKQHQKIGRKELHDKKSVYAPCLICCTEGDGGGGGGGGLTPIRHRALFRVNTAQNALPICKDWAE